MVDSNLNLKQSPQDATSLKEIAILWITAGLGCDGESIAMTAATQPSIEDLVLGALPGIPKNVQNRLGELVSMGTVGSDTLRYMRLRSM